MDEVRLTRELVADGLSPVSIRSAVRNGSLQRVRRGAYLQPQDVDEELVASHRARIEATLRQGHPRSVVSHGSAAALREIDVPRRSLDRVHLTRDRRGGGQRRAWLQVHGHPLPAGHVETVGGVAVTTVPRTVLDLACSLPLADGVAVGDAALRTGADPLDLLSVLDEVGTRGGIGRARRVLELLDGRSESYGESVSRVLMRDRGLPAPVPQLRVLDGRGIVVARVDFAWPDLGVVGEFDGKVKYGRKLAPGQDPAEAVWREKLREDRLRSLGWQVVRWIWSDLEHPAAWFQRLEQALSQR